MMIEQCKGKDISDVPVSKLGNLFFASVKYDGNYVQIHKTGNIVKFYTSGNKEFYIEHIADELIVGNPNIDFIIEAEYIAASAGKLGDRTQAARLTTYRTNFEKGISNKCTPGSDIFKVFDCLKWLDTRCNGGFDINCKACFELRLEYLLDIDLGTHMEAVGFTLGSLAECKAMAKSWAAKGYEGMYLKSPSHVYYPGKRVNDAIKLKVRPTADLLCVDIICGDGKYQGLIGSLVLKDSKGRQVAVGSGLSDADRRAGYDTYIGKVIEIEYEQILATYMQPVFVGIRADKCQYEIN
jgi:ATP-dependent DNA ligase